MHAPEKVPGAKNACDATRTSPANGERLSRLLRAVKLVKKDQSIDDRRMPDVIAAITKIAETRDPLGAVRDILDRADRRKVRKRGGYVSTAIIQEADKG